MTTLPRNLGCGRCGARLVPGLATCQACGTKTGLGDFQPETTVHYVRPRPPAAGRRVAATLLDAAAWLLPAAVLAVVATFVSVPAPVIIGVFAAAAIVTVIAMGLTGISVGRGITGLSVRRPDGSVPGVLRAAVRSICFIVLFVLAGAALWTIPLDRRRRGLHDRLAGTEVMTESPAAYRLVAASTSAA